MDDEDLKLFFKRGEPVKQRTVIEAAEFLCRNGAEVRARLRELGYPTCTGTDSKTPTNDLNGE
jgi:hypothetical protein